MKSKDKAESIDRLIEILSKPLNRYILSVLAGMDPGVFKGTVENRIDSEIEARN